jgi:hypothetical protein
VRTPSAHDSTVAASDEYTHSRKQFALYKLPCRVNHQHKILSAGQTDAGWTVVGCESRDHALQVMRAYPSARMPCWLRIEKGEV